MASILETAAVEGVGQRLQLQRPAQALEVALVGELLAAQGVLTALQLLQRAHRLRRPEAAKSGVVRVFASV